ncbi:pentapeptide repeat-containing protein [Schaalia canis]|uniref:Pentapeptide repeat-containing protein n=1 Tax=Schaalia canis TaxID=100469 RepID=A0A3P1SDL0_9ACTO|nr:pentapeptide repeat-containing protein [Schaalia canis]RRC95057.1 pentapeptide repeat-containing protein [Schaalia canis]
METYSRVFLPVLWALVGLFLVMGLAYFIYPAYVPLLGTQRSRESFIFTAVAGVGGASLVGLQFRGRWFAERAHLYDQWVQGMQLLSASTVPDRIKGVEVLLGLLENARWSYEAKVLRFFAEYLRRNPYGPQEVELRIVNAMGDTKSFGDSWFRQFFISYRRSSSISLDLSGVTLNVPISWRRMHFSCPINFSGAVFVNGADFSGTTFCGGADFSSTVFWSEASFDESHFLCEADFRDSSFETGASFYLAYFRRIALFRDTCFGGRVLFERSIFMDSVDFLNSGKSELRSTNFQGDANFSATIFYRDAYFGGNQRVSGGQFKSSIFEGEAKFNGAIFHGIADFSGVRFMGGVSFSRLRADLSQSSPTIFCSQANFVDADISSGVLNVGRERVGHEVFSGAIFNGDAYFSFAGLGESFAAIRGGSL